MSTKHIQVICHDHNSVLAASFVHVSESGGELVVKSEMSDPVFAIKSKIFLDILDETTGQSIHVQARLAQAVRQEKQWTYLIRWSACPALLKGLIQAA